MADKVAASDKKTSKQMVDDEEFEEFPVQEWAEKTEGEDELSVWEDNWDEEALDCPFSKQLKEELIRHGHSV